MENYDEILKALDNFNESTTTSGEPLPFTLEEYFKNVAKTGATHFSWKKIKLAFTRKLENVMTTYEEDFPISSNPILPNVENLTFEDMSIRLRKYLSELSGIPFTIQRVCELLVEPRRHYKRTGNFLRGIEKNINVIATVDEHGNSENLERKYTESELNSITSDSWNTNSKDPQVEDILSDIERDHAEKLSKGLIREVIHKELPLESILDDDIPVFDDIPSVPTTINGICNHHQPQPEPHNPTKPSLIMMTPDTSVDSSLLVSSTSVADNLDIPITTIDTACISQDSSLRNIATSKEEADDTVNSNVDEDNSLDLINVSDSLDSDHNINILDSISTENVTLNISDSITSETDIMNNSDSITSETGIMNNSDSITSESEISNTTIDVSLSENEISLYSTDSILDKNIDSLEISSNSLSNSMNTSANNSLTNSELETNPKDCSIDEITKNTIPFPIHNSTKESIIDGDVIEGSPKTPKRKWDSNEENEEESALKSIKVSIEEEEDN